MIIKKKAWIRYHSIPICISVITFLVGQSLIPTQSNVVNRVALFPDGADKFVGIAMMVLAIGKVVALLQFRKPLQKAFLIGIAVSWLLIGWSYRQSGGPTTAYAMAWGIAAICYIELWRGDFTG